MNTKDQGDRFFAPLSTPHLPWCKVSKCLDPRWVSRPLALRLYSFLSVISLGRKKRKWPTGCFWRKAMLRCLSICHFYFVLPMFPLFVLHVALQLLLSLKKSYEISSDKNKARFLNPLCWSFFQCEYIFFPHVRLWNHLFLSLSPHFSLDLTHRGVSPEILPSDSASVVCPRAASNAALWETWIFHSSLGLLKGNSLQ